MIEVVLYTDTNGLSVKDGHRIVEIGCIELENLIPTSNRFHCYLNPERKVSEKALEVHGYTDEFLSSKKKFIEIADEFLSFIKDKKLIMDDNYTIILPFDLPEADYEDVIEYDALPNLLKTFITQLQIDPTQGKPESDSNPQDLQKIR